MEKYFTAIDNIIEKYDYDKRSLLPILQAIQQIIPNKYIPEDVVNYVAKKLDTTSSNIYEVITFFSDLQHKPKGKYLIKLCESTVCSLKKNNKILKVLEETLGIKIGETTKDMMFTLEYSPCFGACDISPAMRINKRVYGNLDEDKVKDIISTLRGSQDE